MRPSIEIRRILEKHADMLKILLPEDEYEGLVRSYVNCSHHQPNERQQKKDLRYLTGVLKLES